MNLRPYDVSAEREAALHVDRGIPFAETHHHLWELGRFKYDWLTGSARDDVMGDYRAICVDWGPERFFREFYGQNVIKSVHVEAGYSGPDPVEETAWLQVVGDTFGYPHALVVMCDLERDDAEATLIRHLEASPRVRGVRDRTHHSEPDRSEIRAGYAALRRLGLSYELHGSPGQLSFGRGLAEAGIPVILSHAGFPIGRDPEYFAFWRREVEALAEMDNIACKISGFASVDHNWSVADLRPWVLHCIEAFGVERAMFGTNWPVDGLYAPIWSRSMHGAASSRTRD